MIAPWRAHLYRPTKVTPHWKAGGVRVRGTCPLPARDPHLLHSPPNPEEGPPPLPVMEESKAFHTQQVLTHSRCAGKGHPCPKLPDLHTHPTFSLPGQGPSQLSRRAAALPPCREVLLTVPFAPPAAVSLYCLSSWGVQPEAPSCPETPRPGPSQAQPSLGWLRPIQTHITSGCESSQSPLPISWFQFSHRLPKTQASQGEAAVVPRCADTAGRNQEHSLRALAPEGFLDEAVRFGVGRGRDRWGGAQRPGK